MLQYRPLYKYTTLKICENYISTCSFIRAKHSISHQQVRPSTEDIWEKSAGESVWAHEKGNDSNKAKILCGQAQ
jgi:hypothetical protein